MAEWAWTIDERLRWIEQCLDFGVTTFDHADIYGNYSVEGLFGEALARSPRLRARMQLVSKCGIKLVSPQRPQHAGKSYDTSRPHIVGSVDRSLAALGTDHLDLLLIHRPDALMDPDEVGETFEQLRAAGKVRHFGVSNHSPSQFDLLHRRLPLVTNQVELSPLAMRVLGDGTLDQATALKVRPMIWSPLGGGRLFSSDEPAAQRVRATIGRIAQARGAETATIAYAWILRHPSRPLPITGSRRVSALREAIAALAVNLSSQEWYAIWEAGAGREIP